MLLFMVASCDAVCKDNQFACADGKQCIPIHDVCNGYDRCKDGSDEAPELCKGWDCNKTGAGYFKCGNGLRCVRPWEVCDGYRECKDRSDEEEGHCRKWDCYEGYWKCRDNLRCVSEFYLCDGKDHCRDGSDEDNRPGGGCYFKRAKRLKTRINQN